MPLDPKTQEAINRDLRERSDSAFQQKILTMVRDNFVSSSNKMCQYWNQWDQQQDIYRGYRLIDKNDKSNITNGKLKKIIVPITYAQIQTAISFIFSTFLQKSSIFELNGMGPEDAMPAQGLEVDLNYQGRKDKFLFKLYNWLLDSLKFGFGVVKTEWKTEKENVRVRREIPSTSMSALASSFFGGKPKMTIKEVVESIIRYEGNTTLNVSPYSFYPDPDVPIAKFQDGSFVGHEETLSWSSIRNMEGSIYHGTDKIPNYLASSIINLRGRRYPMSGGEGMENKEFVSAKQAISSCLVSEMIINIVPSKIKEEIDLDLGSDNVPVRFIATIANDSKLIRFEPYNYLHGRYGYSIIEYSPDATQFYNPGISGTINELQNIMSWLLNSHVQNVQKAIFNSIVYNPDAVEAGDITSGSPYIRSKGATSLDEAVKQLSVMDVTKGHIGDMDTILKFIQLVTGINDNALGQYAPGRRSASEARSVNAGASARLRMHANLAWYMGIEPLAQQWLANTRQGRTPEMWGAILGNKSMECPWEKCILTDPEKIALGVDFIPYEATLPSDKQQRATVLSDVFKICMGNPEMAQVLGLNIVPLFKDIMALQGINNISDYSMQQAQAPGQVQVVPDQQVQQMVGNGQVEPVNVAGMDMMSQLQGMQQ